MKNLLKLVRIIALVAVIGFSFAACGGGGGGGGGGSWPPANVRSPYGIGGLNQPPNITAKTYYIVGNQLNIAFTTTNNDATKTYLNNWFTSDGWTVDMNTATQASWMKVATIPNVYFALYNYDEDLSVLAVSNGP